MICKFGKNFAFLKMFEESPIPRYQQTLLNIVEKGQHGSSGSCLADSSFPREAFELVWRG